MRSLVTLSLPLTPTHTCTVSGRVSVASSMLHRVPPLAVPVKLRRSQVSHCPFYIIRPYAPRPRHRVIPPGILILGVRGADCTFSHHLKDDGDSKEQLHKITQLRRSTTRKNKPTKKNKNASQPTSGNSTRDHCTHVWA